eukprot:scaffold153214_cov82-Attheya_sp.AAC.1
MELKVACSHHLLHHSHSMLSNGWIKKELISHGVTAIYKTYLALVGWKLVKMVLLAGRAMALGMIDGFVL